MSVAFTAALSQDLVVVPGDPACTRAAQLERDWTCFRARGDQYLGTPLVGSVDGRVDGGVALGPTRALVGAELAFERFAVGARLGWALRGLGPAANGQERVIPLSGELLARVRLVQLGIVRVDLLSTLGLRVVDARRTVVVREDPAAAPSLYQLDNPPTQKVDAYKRLGTSFVSLGPAVTVALGGHLAVRGELAVTWLWPSTGWAFGPTVGLVVTP
jgi:hypothetical protein